MKLLHFICTASIWLIGHAVFAQSNFDSIKICHDQKGRLHSVGIGAYQVHLSKGKLDSFHLKDGSISYNETNKSFWFSNLIKNEYLIIQLVQKGVTVETADTAFLISSPGNLLLTRPNAYALVELGSFILGVDFDNNNLKKLTLDVSNKFIVIHTNEIERMNTWNFIIDSVHHVNELFLNSQHQQPFILRINDDAHKVSVRLFAKNGIIRYLDGLRFFGKDDFYSDKYYTLKYSKSGKLKRKRSGFKLSCINS